MQTLVDTTIQTNISVEDLHDNTDGRTSRRAAT